MRVPGRTLSAMIVVILVAGCFGDAGTDGPGDESDGYHDGHGGHGHHGDHGQGDGDSEDLGEWAECRIRTEDGALPCPAENLLEKATGFQDPVWRCTGTFRQSVAYFWHEDLGLMGMAWNLTAWHGQGRVEIEVQTEEVTFRYGREGPMRTDAVVFPVALPEEDPVRIDLYFLDPMVQTDLEALQGGDVSLHWFLYGTGSLPVYSITQGDEVYWFTPDAAPADEYYEIVRPYGSLVFDVQTRGGGSVAWSFVNDEGDACDAFR